MAQEAGDAHFNLADGRWENALDTFNLTNDDLYALLNKPFLDEVIQKGLPVRFTEYPRDAGGALQKEFEYLWDKGYRIKGGLSNNVPQEVRRRRMYINGIDELYDTATKYFGSRGKCRPYMGDAQSVDILLYESIAFRLDLPRRPYTSLSFQHVALEKIAIQDLLGFDLTFVENTQAGVEAAFDVLDRYARLRLPDKFLEAFEALHREDS